MISRESPRSLTLLAGLALALGSAGATPADAAASGARAAPPERVILARQSYTDVIAGLERNGYRVVSMSSTMLGRVKILAQNRVHLREIVVSRSTGEIKHDVILKVFKTREEEARSRAGRSAGVDVGGGSDGGSGGGTSAGVDEGGVSVSTGGGGGASASVGGGGASVSAGGVGVSIGN